MRRKKRKTIGESRAGTGEKKDGPNDQRLPTTIPLGHGSEYRHKHAKNLKCLLDRYSDVEEQLGAGREP